MKTNVRLIFLIALTFIVFALPFFEACTGKEFEQTVEIQDEEIIDSIGIKANIVEDTIKETIIEKDTIVNIKEEKKSEKKYFQRKESSIYNAYQLAYFMTLYENITNYDKTTLIALIILLIILNSLIMLLLVFKNKIKTIYKVGILSLILAVTWFIYVLILDPDLEQIKYGFYLYLINIILVILESKRVLSKINLEMSI